MEFDKITIHQEDNICTTCGRRYTHRRRHFLEDNMKCVEFITAHPGCRVLVNKIKKMKEDLIELEFELFCKTI